MFWRRFKSRYQLIGTICKNCNSKFYPPRNVCPTCRRDGKIEEVMFKNTGKIVSYTIIHTGPTGFEKQTPYPVAIIELNNGPKITAQIVDCESDELKIGLSVKSTFRKIYEDGKDGIIHYGLKFKPVKNSN